VEKPEGKRQTGRARYKWEDNINMDLRERGWWWYRLDSSGSGQGPVKGSCEHGNEVIVISCI
jgi:hypothetical protein